MLPIFYGIFVKVRLVQWEREYILAKQTWDDHHISHYWFLVDTHICGAIDYRIVRYEVKNGTTISTSNANTHEEIHDRCPERFNSIDKIFATIDSSIKYHADRLIVEYDPSYGYPKTVDYDLRREVEYEESAFEITDFGVLP